MQQPTIADVLAKIAAYPNRRDALLNQNEAPVYCSIAKQQMAQLRYTGNGPKFYKPTPRSVLYRVGDLDDWINSHVCKSTADAVWTES